MYSSLPLIVSFAGSASVSHCIDDSLAYLGEIDTQPIEHVHRDSALANHTQQYVPGPDLVAASRCST